MKNCLKSSLTIFLAFVFISLQGQVKFGPKAGVNLSTMTLKSSGISIDPTILVGFHVGLISEISITDNLVLQPGVFYSTKGSKYKISYLQQSYESSIAPSYIDIPINLNYYFGAGKTKIAFFAGPYVAYGIGGKAKSDGESADISFGSTEDNDMKPLDFGINIGAGVNLNGLLISAQYGLGLANLVPTSSSDAEMKNRAIGISITYLLGGK
jgi:hypothetical protein